MSKYFALLVLAVVAANAQSATDVLTNDTVVKMVQAGVPSATIIKTINTADRVDFRFIGPDLQRLTDARVPDDVFKAMAARDKKGGPISAGTPTPSVQPPASQPPVRLEPPRPTPQTNTQTGLTNESLIKLVKAGMSEDVILGMVNNQPTKKLRMSPARAANGCHWRRQVFTIRRKIPPTPQRLTVRRSVWESASTSW